MSDLLKLLDAVSHLRILVPKKKGSESSQLESGQRIAGLVASIAIGLFLLIAAFYALSGS